MSKVRAIRDELDGTEPLYVRIALIRRLLRVPECAEILGCSTRQVANAVGIAPAHTNYVPGEVFRWQDVAKHLWKRAA
jgi:hypothetical protein